ncbi:hypothetical protein E2C01_064077 [Portunus trituberculatus]|uniref:Uncharacterized protein n=1 Tax=Portunus trituberculatus TaxID=210409 RepID=A0A5B7HIS8_PORTR|nr:hypothetical protein [Portunus trituberculatus]
MKEERAAKERRTGEGGREKFRATGRRKVEENSDSVSDRRKREDGKKEERKTEGCLVKDGEERRKIIG